MNLKPLPLATAAVLGAALALSACKRDEPVTTTDVATPAPAPAPAPAPQPPSGPPVAAVTAVDLGNAIDADGRVVAGTSTFAPTDTITASVTTDTGAPQTSATGTLAARWTFEDGQVVNEESKTFQFDGRGTTNFQISKPDGWPVGRYRVEISLDGDVVQTRDFEVRA
jgi:type V secretory pathway adhesin AidA